MKTLDKMTKHELLSHIANLETRLASAERSAVRSQVQPRATRFPTVDERKAFFAANPNCKTASPADIVNWASR